MSNILDKIYSHRLIIVMGKGGVGKTTTAAALAVEAANKGLKVCLCENSHTEAIAPLFGKKSVGAVETLVRPGLHILNLSPRSCFENYVTQTIRSRTLFRLLFNNKLVHLFVEALPGFDEILMFTEMYNMSQKGARGKKANEYDLVIFDAPATGHGVNFLSTPRTLMDMVSKGPVHNLCKSVYDRLTDSTLTTLVPVTLGEEMPVAETLEMMAKLKGVMEVDWSPVLVNMISESSLNPEQLAAIQELWPEDGAAGELYGALYNLQQQAQLNNAALSRLRDAVDQAVVAIPKLAKLGVRETERSIEGLGELVCHLKNS
ncbi:MAG: ArsA-related P-loop ATPase [Planctomycetota bacterium]|nr:ArsA-related P-loop ATPase [Planctomycetota bacterium]